MPSRPTRSRPSAGSSGSTGSWTGATAREIAANSYEAVVAPGYSQAAIGILKAKAGLEILAVPPDPTEGMRDYGIANLDFKRVAGGLLVESLDELGLDRGRLQVVTNRRPTLDELNDLLFAWRAVRHVRSNAIVLARNGATVGIGAAQASRQVSVEIALRRAGDRAKTAVMASDAYFPFPDGIQMAAQAGVTAIIQPGGSIRDEMAIEVADRHHMAMVFTGKAALPTLTHWDRPAGALRAGALTSAPRPSMEQLLALEMVRVTEAAALASARFMGRGEKDEADRSAVEAMRRTMDEIEFAGQDRHRRGRARRGADALHRRAGRPARAGRSHPAQRSTSRSTRSRARTSSPTARRTRSRCSRRRRRAASSTHRTPTSRSCASGRASRARSTSGCRRPKTSS